MQACEGAMVPAGGLISHAVGDAAKHAPCDGTYAAL
jgi:hypothetical protein